jgi:hypothetical protein
MSGNSRFSYAPSYENEVVLLFRLLMPYLDSQFVIDEYSGSFPDCLARRDGKEIGIEFEVNSKDFFSHKHHKDPNLFKCNLIVCWENYWKKDTAEFSGHKIEIFEHSEFVKQKGFHFVHSDKTKYGKRTIWNEPSFFNELRKKSVADVFDRVTEIYGFCMSRPEFEVVFGEGAKIAGFNVRIKKWQKEGIGVRSPIQVLANGKLTVDYQKLPENLEVELRRMTGNPKDGKTGKPKVWHTLDLGNEDDFGKIKETLKWIAETSEKD